MEQQPVTSYPLLDMEQTGKKLKVLRKKRGVSVEELRRFLGFTTGRAIYQWEKGRTLPTLDNFYAVSRYFQVAMEDLLDEKKEEQREPLEGTVQRTEATSGEGERSVCATLPDQIVCCEGVGASPQAVEEADKRILEILEQGSSQLCSDLYALLRDAEEGTWTEVIRRLPVLMELAIREFAADHNGALPADSYYDAQRLDDYLLVNVHKWLCAERNGAITFWECSIPQKTECSIPGKERRDKTALVICSSNCPR